MKKRIVLIFGLLISLCLVGSIMILYKNNKITDKVLEYCQNESSDTYTIDLKDYTDFSWDYVIIYQNATSKSDILEVTGIKLNRELKKISGMIFIKDEEIVHEENFSDEFIIYPYQDIDFTEKINVFKKDNAIFNGEKEEDKYIFRPINFNSDLSYSKDELCDFALDYFIMNSDYVLTKKEYSIGIDNLETEEYQNKDMVVIEIRHVNNSINTLDARYYINIYNGVGFDDEGNEIKLFN